jgi:Blastomyces yeast-phase-specific protein
MLKALLTLTSLAFAPLAAAIGSARIVNNCDCPVTVWSVGGSIAGPWTLAASGGSYSEPFVKDPVSGGKALKVTKDPNGLYNGDPETIFAYNLDGGNVWYDLSDVFGDAFAGQKLVEASADSSCPAIEWDTGVSPGGSQVKVCEAESDVTLTLCCA